MLEEAGFTDVVIGSPVDTFGGAEGEQKARSYEVYGYAFLARKPDGSRPTSGVAVQPLERALEA